MIQQTPAGKLIAATILEQLGGRQFMAMSGTKPLYFEKNKAMFRLTRNKSKAMFMEITLNSMDTYDMLFFALTRDHERTVKAEFSNIYNDQLQDIFTEVTGLYTIL
jgi:hypothetical protein